MFTCNGLPWNKPYYRLLKEKKKKTNPKPHMKAKQYERQETLNKQEGS